MLLRVVSILPLALAQLGALARPGAVPQAGDAAETRTPLELFESIGSAVPSSAADDLTVIRTRIVRVRREGLVRSMGPARTLSGERTSSERIDLPVRIELFDGRFVLARIERRERVAPQGEVIFGTVLDAAGGSVTIAFAGDAVSGTVRVGAELYKLQPREGGVEVLAEIDQARFPTCATTSEHIVHSAAPEIEPAPQSDLVALPAIIDVLVVYTPEARAAEGGTAAMEALIDLAVAETNQAYAQSQVTQQLRLVHRVELAGYVESSSFGTELTRLTNPADGSIDEVHALRDTYGADAVTMIIANVTSCGIAWQMHGVNPSFESSAFNVVSRVCATGYYTFGHELGHNMGCAHDRDTALTTTRRISLSGGGLESVGSSGVPRLSADARFVVFYSDAADFVPGDVNGQGDVILAGLTTSERALMSVSSSGVQGNAISWWPSISGDGRFVVYESDASNLVPGDTNGVRDIFVRDRLTSTTTRVSQDSAGVEANGASGFADVSRDGRFVVFESDADNLVADDTNWVRDVFVRDLWTNTTVRVSASAAGVEGNDVSGLGALSGDGQWVAFHSNADNLVADDTNGTFDAFVRHLATGTVLRASVDSSGVQGDQASGRAALSFDGRYCAFQSYASNLVAGDANAELDVFVRDLLTGVTIRASEGGPGVDANGPSSTAVLSSDGSLVAFDSSATNLVLGDTNGVADVFVRDLASGAVRRVSVSSSGVQGDALSLAPSLSGDGRYTVFLSDAESLVPLDTNGATDIFMQDGQLGTTSASFSYSYGYRTPSSLWRTVMAYAPGARVQYFSNPNVTFAGEALGIADPDPFAAENWKSLNNTAATVAAWRAARIEAYCFGDGMDAVVTAACPCTNFGDPGHGCANSNPAFGGGLLTAEGTLQPNTLLLTCTNVPNNTLCTFLRGNANNPAGVLFGDGVSCVGGTVLRFGQQNAGQNGNPSNTATAGVSTVAPGNTRYYQCQYRNPSGAFCPPELYNITNGVRVIW